MHILNTIRRGKTGFRALCVFALALLGSAALAQTPPTYRLAAINDQASGQIVVDGDYDEAISRLHTKAQNRPPQFTVHNNLCVALVASGRFNAASETCDQAVQTRHKLIRRSRNAPLHLRRDYAIALSNRGVLRALDGDLAGARDDFEEAIAQRSRLEEPSGNLARLKAVTERRAAAI